MIYSDLWRRCRVSHRVLFAFSFSLTTPDDGVFFFFRVIKCFACVRCSFSWLADLNRRLHLVDPLLSLSTNRHRYSTFQTFSSSPFFSGWNRQRCFFFSATDKNTNRKKDATCNRDLIYVNRNELMCGHVYIYVLNNGNDIKRRQQKCVLGGKMLIDFYFFLTDFSWPPPPLNGQRRY